MRILLSNDDGVHAPGLQVLFEALSRFAEVWVVAPQEEKSTTGHSLTLHQPLRIHSVKDHFFSVNGSPADCVVLGLAEVLRGKKVDWVISGINRGPNLGQDVYYSGTVSAAREGCILGIPSMAVSLAYNLNRPIPDSELHYATAARYAAEVVEKMKRLKLQAETLLNLNVPNLAPARVRGIRFARQGHRYYDGRVLKRKDHRGRAYYWIGGPYQGFREGNDTDCHLIENRYASLTPMQLDTTDVNGASMFPKEWKPPGRELRS